MPVSHSILLNILFTVWDLKNLSFESLFFSSALLPEKCNSVALVSMRICTLE